MGLRYHFHPLASFCWKVLIALYENGTPFEPVIVNLGDEASRSDFESLWPIAKMPVLEDEERDRNVPETSIIIEYLDRHYPGTIPMLPADADIALQTRLWDRFYDLYVHQPMQKIVADRLRPDGKKDPHGVETARAQLGTSYGMIDERMATRSWAMGDDFTMADCAAASALFYANEVMPFEAAHPHMAAYLQRLKARPSFARVLEEAEPYFKLFPRE